MLQKGNRPLKYRVIYADPPWSYNDKMDGHNHGAETHYQTQGIEWIKSLAVSEIAEKDSILFMWAVSPLLPEAFDVIKAWGFKYKTVGFCWIKETPLFNTVANLGRYTMGGMEICLIATKGSPKRVSASVRQIVYAQRTAHSRKPNEVRTAIVDLMGDVSRVELFARQKHNGWDSWGNEVKSDLDLDCGSNPRPHEGIGG